MKLMEPLGKMGFDGTLRDLDRLDFLLLVVIVKDDNVIIRQM